MSSLQNPDEILLEDIISEHDSKGKSTSDSNVHRKPTSTPRWKNYTLEPIIFFSSVVGSLMGTSTTNLLMDRACTVNLNYSAELCKDLGNRSDILDQVQIITSTYTYYSTIVKMAPAVLMSIFIGPWSDKYGRKIPMYFSMLGLILSETGMVIFANLTTLPVYYILFFDIPFGITGGPMTMFTSIHAMATMKTTEKSRTLKFTIIEIVGHLGSPLGTVISGYLFMFYGYIPIFSLALGIRIFLLIYVYLVLVDDTEQKIASTKVKFLEFFSCDSLKENFKTATKARENYGRAQILMVGFASCITALGGHSFSFLYVKKMYNWDLTYYSNVKTVYTVMSMVAKTTAVLLLTKVWRLSDPFIGIIGVSSHILKNIGHAFAFKPWIYFAAMGVGSLGSVEMLAIQSHLSKLVEKHELGKLFSVMMTMVALCPMLGSYFFTSIYNASLSFFPGLCSLIESGLFLAPLGVFIWVTRLPKASIYKTLEEEDGGSLLNKCSEEKLETAIKV